MVILYSHTINHINLQFSMSLFGVTVNRHDRKHGFKKVGVTPDSFHMKNVWAVIMDFTQ